MLSNTPKHVLLTFGSHRFGGVNLRHVTTTIRAVIGDLAALAALVAVLAFLARGTC